MEWQNLLVDSCAPALSTVERALEQLSKEDLAWQPRRDCNSIGWTTWHLDRALDKLISSIMEEEQLWLKDGWYARFNRSPDPDDSGFGHSTEQVAAFECPNLDTLLGYHRAVIERMEECLGSLSSSDLDREVTDNWSELCPTVAARLVFVFDELIQHAGQVGYIRGLRHGKGWQDL